MEAALQALHRGQEAVVCCPASQLRGGALLPDPPAAGGEGGGKAAPAYAEFRVQLLDFSQVLLGASLFRNCCRDCLLGFTQLGCSAGIAAHPSAALPVPLPQPCPPPPSLPAFPAPPACLQVRDMTGDGQVVKRIVRKGVGEFPVDCPLEDSHVRAHYRCAAGLVLQVACRGPACRRHSCAAVEP